MKNEDLFIELVKAYIQASNGYDFSRNQWVKDFKGLLIECENGGFNNYHSQLKANISSIFPFMFIDRAIPILDKSGRANWKVGFNLEFQNGVVFLKVLIGIDKKVLLADVVASKELFHSNFALTDLITKHKVFKKSAVDPSKQNQSDMDIFLRAIETDTAQGSDDCSNQPISALAISHASQLHLPVVSASKPIRQPFVSYRHSHQYTLE